MDGKSMVMCGNIMDGNMGGKQWSMVTGGNKWKIKKIVDWNWFLFSSHGKPPIWEVSFSQIIGIKTMEILCYNRTKFQNENDIEWIKIAC